MKHWKTTNKKSQYSFKPHSSIVLVYNRLTDYNTHHSLLMSNQTDDITTFSVLREQTNILVYIAKQKRYRIIRGYFTDYQIEQITNEINEHYKDKKEADLKELSSYRPFYMDDCSHVPPDASFVHDEIIEFDIKYPKK